MHIFYEMDKNITVLKTIFICFFTFLTNYKLQNIKIKNLTKINFILKIIAILIIAVLCGIIRYRTNYSISMFLCCIFIIVIFNRYNIRQSSLTTIISLIINYMIKFIAATIYYIPNRLININNQYVDLLIIEILTLFILIAIGKINRIKYGFPFLNKKENSFVDLIILNIVGIIFFGIILYEGKNELQNNFIGPIVLTLGFISFLSIEKSIQLYYKQKLLIQDLNETKKDLEIKTKEVQTLEQENLSYSKKAHSLEHKLKSLENKINKLTYNQEISKEIGIDKQIEDISNQMHNKIVYIELDKTGIEEIDDMLDSMRNEAINNNIEFNFQLKGNIYQMTNNFVDKHDLAILLADHIKDAIIAINHSENINRSILVRLGKIDNCFALYIYDTGVEFKQEVLDNLGKIPITTYKQEGGTGMGFMNTFDTLDKTKASLTIKQIGPPSKDNYTKVIMITFDGKHEVTIHN